MPSGDTTMSLISELFGRSPIGPLVEHTKKVHECVKQVTPLMEACVREDYEEIHRLQDKVSKLEYEADLLDFMQVRRSDLTRDFILESNASAGKIKMAMAGTEPINGSGTLFELVFNARQDISTGTTEIAITESRFNEYKPQSAVSSAKVVVAGSATKELGLSQNFPNPFNPETVIQFSIPQATHVKVDILNSLGQKVATLADGYKEPGSYRVGWDGTDNQGNPVANGIYFYRLVTEECTVVKKMLLIK